MGFCSGRLKIVAILVLLSACAHAPPAVPAAAAPAGPSPQALRNEWLKGYQAGLYEGRREQARRDRVLFLPSTLPPPPPPGMPAVAAPAAAAPAPAVPAVVPPVPAPPQSVFVPAGPAEPVTTNP